MKPNSDPSGDGSLRSCVLKVLAEGVVAAVAGLALALGANLVSPRGLDLGRNYFPGGIRPLRASPPSPGNPTTGSGTNAAGTAPADALAARIREHGLQVITGSAAHERFQDPGLAGGLIVFVDARNAEEYQTGHIPGAYLFDHYRAGDYLPTVLPACLPASQVIVYCTGGDCEDSEFAALMLRDAGIAADRLFVFTGGFTEWLARGWPVETGAQSNRSPPAQAP